MSTYIYIYTQLVSLYHRITHFMLDFRKQHTTSLVTTIITNLVDGAHAFNAKCGREAGRLPWWVNARRTQQIRWLHGPTPHVHHHLPKASSRSSHHSHHQLVHHGQGQVVSV